MTRVVGSKNRSELVLDPLQAWRRGRALDRMLAAARSGMRKGVLRGTHAEFNRHDDRRALEAARRLNAP